MPDRPDPKAHAHPWTASPDEAIPPYAPAETPYAELTAASNFSFLRGASHPDELVFRAAILGYRAIAVTDRNSLAGVVRGHVAARELKVPYLVGCRLQFVEPDWLSLFVYPTDRAAYGRLCQLLTLGKRRAPKGECHLYLHDVEPHADGLLAIAMFSQPEGEEQTTVLKSLAHCFGEDRLSLAMTCLYGPDDRQHLEKTARLAERLHIPLVATNDVYYHAPQRRILQDVLTCIRHGCTLAEAGFRLFPNAERYLKPPGEMVRLFAAHPEALARTVEIAGRAAAFSLDELKYEYPHEICPPGMSAMDYLRRLTWQGAREKYPEGIPERVIHKIETECKLIDELNYAPFFLTVHDIVCYARSRGILCQGRGAAANSVVCYLLGITSVGPELIDMLFERFVSKERAEPPDIDVDFEHERREEVIQYIYEKYGRDRAGLTAEVITYRSRSAVRDVGKALGLSLDAVDRIAKHINTWAEDDLTTQKFSSLGFNPDDPTLSLLIYIMNEIVGFPRHLSQHVGGFVISRGPLCELVPIENAAMEKRTVIEWDKDDIEALGMLKVDVLGLGMLTCISKCLKLLREQGTGNREQDSNTTATSETNNGEWKRFSRPDRMAKGNHAHQADISNNSEVSGFGTFRLDVADATSGSIGAQQYRRRKCAPDGKGLPEISHDCTRVDGRTRDTVDHRIGIEPSQQYQSNVEDSRRGKAHSAGSDSEFTTTFVAPPGVASIRSSQAHYERAASLPACSLFPVPCSLADIPPEDPRVYDMICLADTIGVFQIESRAQMTMLPRLKPRYFYDLVIEVAIVRPGPIVGNMVHPYLRRRNGVEKPDYPDEKIKKVLEKTLGVPLFQEQAMALAIVAADFTPGEAEMLRRTISAWKSRGKDSIPRYQTRFIEGMVKNGYQRDFAEQCFERLKGFSEYGFPESHSASFALLVYASAWLKCYYPAAFAAALLNSQPMGFYAPAQIVRDARDHNVKVRPVDVNLSEWDCTLEEGSGNREQGTESGTFSSVPCSLFPVPSPALRLGLRMVSGLREADARAIVDAVRRHGPFASPLDLWRASEVSASTFHRLALADAFGSMNLDRQQALWAVQSLHGRPLPLFDAPDAAPAPAEPPVTLPAVSAPAEVVRDYRATGLSLKSHPIAFLREQLAARRILTAAEMRDEHCCPHGRHAAVAGLVLFRQRPSTAKGVIFMTLEDETGRADLIIRKRIAQQFSTATLYGQLLIARGRVERSSGVVHMLVNKIEEFTYQPGDLPSLSRDFR